MCRRNLRSPLKTKASVEQFSQVRLSYSEKMETLEVLGAYTITADGQRRDVPADRITPRRATPAPGGDADRKVRVIVFPNLAPGTRLYYQVRRTQARTSRAISACGRPSTSSPSTKTPRSP